MIHCSCYIVVVRISSKFDVCYLPHICPQSWSNKSLHNCSLIAFKLMKMHFYILLIFNIPTRHHWDCIAHKASRSTRNLCPHKNIYFLLFHGNKILPQNLGFESVNAWSPLGNLTIWVKYIWALLSLSLSESLRTKVEFDQVVVSSTSQQFL